MTGITINAQSNVKKGIITNVFGRQQSEGRETADLKKLIKGGLMSQEKFENLFKRKTTKKSIFFNLFITFLFSITTANSIAQTTFQKLIGGAGTDSGRDVEFTADGGYMIVGHTTTNSNGFADMYVIKTDAFGDTLWTKKIGGSGVEGGYTVQRISDGNYILSGFTTSYGAGGQDAFLVKIDPNGNTAWEKSYGGSGADRIEAAYENPDGTIIAVGASDSDGTNSQFFLIKTTSAGDTIWTRKIGGSAFEYGNMVKPTSDGGYIIVGQTFSYGAGSGDYYMVKTDGNGDTTWTKTFGGANLDEAKNVRQTADGGYIITGDAEMIFAGDQDIYIVKTDANGNISWTKTYRGNDKDISKMIEQTPDGGYIVAGITRSFGQSGPPDWWVLKTNSTGDTLWTRMYGGSSNEHLYAIKPEPGGSYIAVGHSASYGNNEQVYLMKLNSQGDAPAGSVEYEHEIFTLFPNPSEGLLYVQMKTKNASVMKILDVSGRVISTVNIEGKATLDISAFPDGLYFCEILHKNKRSVIKVIKL